MAYRLIVLLTEQTTLTLDELAERLRKRFSNGSDANVILGPGDDRVLRVQWSDRSFELGYEAEPHVLLESQQIVASYAVNHPDQAKIAGCSRRLVMGGDDDPNMDHFNDYVFILEVLESFAGLYLFDPQEGAFVNESS